MAFVAFERSLQALCFFMSLSSSAHSRSSPRYYFCPCWICRRWLVRWKGGWSRQRLAASIILHYLYRYSQPTFFPCTCDLVMMEHIGFFFFDGFLQAKQGSAVGGAMPIRPDAARSCTRPSSNRINPSLLVVEPRLPGLFKRRGWPSDGP